MRRINLRVPQVVGRDEIRTLKKCRSASCPLPHFWVRITRLFDTWARIRLSLRSRWM